MVRRQMLGDGTLDGKKGRGVELRRTRIFCECYKRCCPRVVIVAREMSYVVGVFLPHHKFGVTKRALSKSWHNLNTAIDVCPKGYCNSAVETLAFVCETEFILLCYASQCIGPHHLLNPVLLIVAVQLTKIFRLH